MSEYDELVERLRAGEYLKTPAIIDEAAQAIERLEANLDLYIKADNDGAASLAVDLANVERGLTEARKALGHKCIELAEARAREERAIPSFKWAHDRLCVDRQLERGEQQRTADWIRLGLEALAAPAPTPERESERRVVHETEPCTIRWCWSGMPAVRAATDCHDDGAWRVSICQHCFDALSLDRDGADLPSASKVQKLLAAQQQAKESESE